MTDWLRELYARYRDIFWYAVFGALTTVVNLTAFYLTTSVWDMTPGSTLAPNLLANALAILFAFVTNRKKVFHSEQKSARGVLLEAARFFLGRAFTLAMDLALVYAFVDALRWPEMPVKTASTALVIVVNYIVSKRLVFRKRAGGQPPR